MTQSPPGTRPTRPRSATLVDAAISRLRVANVDDNDRILDLMADVPMEGQLAVATRRDPDFFDLYRLQRGDHRLWVYDNDDGGPLKGMGGVLVRDGWLDQHPMKVGYLGDLRTRGFMRERLAFPHVYAHLFDQTVQQTGCEHFLTGILADNVAAIQALATSASRRTGKRQGQPHYHLLRRFDMANVHFLRRRGRRNTSGVVVRTATIDDVTAIADFLARDHQQRPFGWRFDDGEFQHRLQQWPGFTLNETYLALDDQRRIVGVTTCWDASVVKRYRVLRYGGHMVWVKRSLSWLAQLTGTAPLPDPGHDFRYFYLCNLSVVDDNPVVFQAIVDAVYRDHARAGFHFFAFPLFEGDPLAGGTRGYFVRRMPFHLYAVTASTKARSDWQQGRPGFEMALA